MITKTVNKLTGYVTGNRIMVLPLDEDEIVEEMTPAVEAVSLGTSTRLSETVIKKKRGSDIILPDSAVQAAKEAKSHLLMRNLVVSVGPLANKDLPVDSEHRIRSGDIVLAFPTTFLADVTIDGTGYLIYEERNILYKE